MRAAVEETGDLTGWLSVWFGTKISSNQESVESANGALF